MWSHPDWEKTNSMNSADLTKALQLFINIIKQIMFIMFIETLFWVLNKQSSQSLALTTDKAVKTKMEKNHLSF